VGVGIPSAISLPLSYLLLKRLGIHTDTVRYLGGIVQVNDSIFGRLVFQRSKCQILLNKLSIELLVDLPFFLH
jgi:hypothetical protein